MINPQKIKKANITTSALIVEFKVYYSTVTDFARFLG